MNHNKISIRFLIARSRINQAGKCSIRCRITFNKKRYEFATGLFINPKNWYSKMQQAKPPNEENSFINSQLSLIINKINQAFLFLQHSNSSFDVDDIYLTYKGEHIKEDKTLMELFTIYNERMHKLIDKVYARKYYMKFVETENTLKKFLKDYYKRKDFQLNKLTLKFLDDYDYYLKSERNLKQITINKNIQRIRRVLKLALSEKYLSNDPFILYKPKRVVKEIVFLTPDELSRLENYKFAQDRLEVVKNLFIFCCYTGLAYREMSSLTQESIITGYDGNLWISMYRQKTKKQFSVPLLVKAINILELYRGKLSDDAVLPSISNQKLNSYLKEIAEIVGINKRLTHHIARKTFATTVLLYNDVPIEIVSELLGHSKISVTQEHYAKVVSKKVSEAMGNLSKKLK